MLIKSQLSDKLFYFSMLFNYSLAGSQIWKRTPSDKTGTSWSVSYIRLIWSFLLFAILIYFKLYLNRDQELTLGNLKHSKYTELGDILQYGINQIKCFALFIPIWVLGYKKKKLFELFGRAEEMLKHLKAAETFNSWEIVIFTAIVHVAYGFYFVKSILYLAELGILTFDGFDSVAYFVKYMGALILTFACISEILICGCHVAVKFNVILEHLQRLENEQLPFLN